MRVTGLLYAETLSEVLAEIGANFERVGITAKPVRNPALDGADLCAVVAEVPEDKAEIARRILSAADIAHGIREDERRKRAAAA